MIRTKKFENLPQITSISPSGKIVVTENGVDKVISFEDFSNLPATNDIWNNASTNFTAYEVNVTDIQSASDSKLLDLKINTVSKFAVRKDGAIVYPGSGEQLLLVKNGETYLRSSSSANSPLVTEKGFISLSTDGVKSYGGSFQLANSIGANGVILERDDANILGLRNGESAQTFRVYNTYTSSTNFERLNIKWDTNVLKLGTEKGSVGGTARAMEFQTNGTTRMTLPATGGLSLPNGSDINFGGAFNFYGTTSSTTINGPTAFGQVGVSINGIDKWIFKYDGLFCGGGLTSSFPALKRDSAGIQIRLADDSGFTSIGALTLSLSGQSLSGSAATSLLDLSTTWNTTGAPTAIKLNVTNTASGAASNLLDLQIGGVSMFKVDKSGVASTGGLTITDATPQYQIKNAIGIAGFNFLYNSEARAQISDYGLNFTNYGIISWTGSASNHASSRDLYLLRDTAGTLAQRNGVNPQTFRLYNTYTDANTFERLNIKWDTNVLKIGTEKGTSGGTARAMEFQTDGITRLSFSADNSIANLSSTNLVVGTQIRVGGQTRITNNSDGVLQISDSSQAGLNRIQLGGTTSSFPAIKRNGAAIQIRLADDSANAALETAGLTVVGSASVSGHFSATTKSFLIPHPTKPDKKLQYACLEGPENGVYIRGKTNEPIILLPDYWSELVDADSITVTVTPIGKPQQLFVVSQNSTSVEIGNVDGLYNYLIFAERKDVNKLQTEI